MLTRLIVVLVLLVSLAACGTDSAPDDGDVAEDTPVAEQDTTTDDADSADTDEASDEEGETFLLTLSGDETLTFDDNPSFGCVRDLASFQTFTQSPKVEIYLPSDVEPGTYDLADFDANREPRYVEGAAVVTVTGDVSARDEDGATRGRFYFQNSTGTLTLEAMPTALDERFIASVDGTLEDRNGNTVNVTIDIDVVNDGSTTLDCQYGE